MSTTKDIHDVCMNVIRIPKMEKACNVSPCSLLKKSGYFEMHDQITIEAIHGALCAHPDYVNDWIQFSEDQRCDPVWFFRQNGADYEVGFWSSKADDTPPTKYSDPLEACATFIKHEIEGIRLST